MTDEQLKAAISEYEIGNKVIARDILKEILIRDPGDEQARRLLAKYAETDKPRVEVLRQALANNHLDQTPRDAPRSPGIEIKSIADQKVASGFAAVAKTGPGLAKKPYDLIDPVEEQPLMASDRNVLEFKFPRRPRVRWFWASLGLLAAVIVLWAVFFILLFNRDGPPLFNAAGSQPAVNGTMPQKTKPVPENTPLSTQPPELTLEPTVASLPTAGQPVIVQFPAGSMDEPVRVGSGYRFAGDGVMAVAGFTWKTGYSGLAVVNLTFACERPAEEICATEMYTFELVSSQGAVYRRESAPSVPQPWFGSIAKLPTYGGAAERGNLGFIVANPENGLLLKASNSLDPGNEVYFKLP